MLELVILIYNVGMEHEVGKMTAEEVQIIERLRPQWKDVAQGLTGNLEYSDETFTEIIQRYRTGDGRSYHNLFHIDRMLGFVNQFGHLAKNKHILKVAIFGHDIVYIPGSQTNEQESADVFGLILQKLSVKEEDIVGIKRLIMITQKHTTTDDDIDGKLMIDSDYEILASPDEIYDQYATNIWKEYVGSGKVSEVEFKQGRKSLINGWLESIRKDRLFLTPGIRKNLQAQARKNLERELIHFK